MVVAVVAGWVALVVLGLEFGRRLAIMREWARAEQPIMMTHPTIDWEVQVQPQYARHYLDDGWTTCK